MRLRFKMQNFSFSESTAEYIPYTHTHMRELLLFMYICFVRGVYDCQQGQVFFSFGCLFLSCQCDMSSYPSPCLPPPYHRVLRA